jgi:hypothetical protein
MNFSSLGCKFKLKFELSRSFELWSFELTTFYCSLGGGRLDSSGLREAPLAGCCDCMAVNHRVPLLSQDFLTI